MANRPRLPGSAGPNEAKGAGRRIVLDLKEPGPVISPLLFGHNLEHTRSCLWQGLSAQLVRNRKFAGLPERGGAAREWYRIGPRESWCLLEIAGGWNGTEGESYTARFDSEPKPAGQRQRAECFRAGAPCGIGQRGIPLVGGQTYEGRVAVRADQPMAVRIAVSAGEPQEIRASAGPQGWTEAPFRFTAARTDSDARLEITFDGPGALFVGAVSLLPTDHFLGMRQDVVALLKEIGVPLLRWPGGNFAGEYRWRDGLLPVDRRAPIESFLYTLPHTGCYDDHEVGTDEFIALCRALGAEPFITINMSLEGPDEAAAWVEYCNGPADSKWGRLRAERGHPEPYRVRYWTLGNEMGYSHMKGPNGPAEYAKAAAACARAMRRVDPSVILTASTAWAKEWYEGVLAAPEEGYFDHLSYHVYDRLLRDFTGDAGRREFRRLVDSPLETFFGTGLVDGRQERRLSMPDMRRMIDARPRGRKDIGIAFDEWNVWYAWYREPGVPEAIHGAMMLNLFCREAHRAGMTLGAFFEPVNEGAILVQPDGARLTPLGRVMALFRPHHGGRLIRAEVSAPGGDLDLAASLDGERKQITLTLVNRSPDESHEAEVVLPGAGCLGAAQGVLLSAPDFLPGTDLCEGRLEVRQRAPDALALLLPKHSVARVLVPYQ